MMGLVRQFSQLCALSGKKQLLSLIPRLNGTVVVVGRNLHKRNKSHSQSKSDRFLALL